MFAVLQTGGVGKNGLSYLLDMGEPIKIVDIAEHIIRFSGFEPNKDIKIEFIGSRKGERFDEPLWIEEENPTKTEFPKILKLKSLPFKDKELKELLGLLKPVCIFNKKTKDLYRNKTYLLKTLCDNVPSLKEFYDAQTKN